MIVPAFWAEARVQARLGARQVTVRRFGWSDVDVAHAQALADERARAALDRIVAGEPLPRRERKRAYNGAEGVPIREEIVERHGETVVTRNAYGARCLNSPDALFADIDFETPERHRFALEVISSLLVLAGVLAAIFGSSGKGLALVFVGVFLVRGLRLAKKLGIALQGGHERVARRRVEAFVARHPDWSIRLYQTPAGLRALATHRPFAPDEPAVREFFEAVGVDPVYATMCLRQHCFRARLTAKPWRIGIADHMTPRPGVWPVAEAQRPKRDAWIARYEDATRAFAACRLLATLGSGAIDAGIAEVQRLHDDACRATSGLPLA